MARQHKTPDELVREITTHLIQAARGLADLCDQFEMPRANLAEHIEPPEQIVVPPAVVIRTPPPALPADGIIRRERRPGRQPRLYIFENREVTVHDLAELAGCCWMTMVERLKAMTPEQAVAHGKRRGTNGHHAPADANGSAD
jgi:hypothetical protein